jgi:hypothetical protein
MKVVLKSGLVIGEQYGAQRFNEKNNQAKGKVLTIDDTSGSIFNVRNGSAYGVFDKEMVNRIDGLSKDELFTVYVQSDMSDAEYEELRRERG